MELVKSSSDGLYFRKSHFNLVVTLNLGRSYIITTVKYIFYIVFVFSFYFRIWTNHYHTTTLTQVTIPTSPGDNLVANPVLRCTGKVYFLREIKIKADFWRDILLLEGNSKYFGFWHRQVPNSILILKGNEKRLDFCLDFKLTFGEKFELIWFVIQIFHLQASPFSRVPMCWIGLLGW